MSRPFFVRTMSIRPFVPRKLPRDVFETNFKLIRLRTVCAIPACGEPLYIFAPKSTVAAGSSLNSLLWKLVRKQPQQDWISHWRCPVKNYPRLPIILQFWPSSHDKFAKKLCYITDKNFIAFAVVHFSTVKLFWSQVTRAPLRLAGGSDHCGY